MTTDVTITADREELVEAIRLVFTLEHDERDDPGSGGFMDLVVERGYALKRLDDLLGVEGVLAANGPIYHPPK